MALQDELRNAVAKNNTLLVQEVLDRIARHYFENSMRRIYGATWRDPSSIPSRRRLIS